MSATKPAPKARRSLIFALILSLCTGGLVTAGASPALADTVLCSGSAYSTCTGAGYTDHAFGSHYTTSHWGAYAGHNCTNYAAYVLSTVNGAPAPGYLLGNGSDWDNNAGAHGVPVNGTPARGAIAQWDVSSMRPSGHVAYVESVNANDSITVSQDTWPAGPFSWQTISAGSTNWPSHFIHFKDTPSAPTPPSGGAGSFNGDSYADLAILHEIADGGFDAHVLIGSTGIPLQNSVTHMRRLSGADGWDSSKIKTTSGDFNGDSFRDIAVVHQLINDGAHVHVLWGGSAVFGYPETFTRALPAADGWQWTKMKVVAGRFNGDGYADLAILHQLVDGGFDAHVLLGSTGIPFQNSVTHMRRLSGVDGWDWNKIKTTSGDFNGDGYADVGVLHQLADDGADVHVLWGGTSIFSHPITHVRRLPVADGWRWSLMKPAAGRFNSDGYVDIAILHQVADGGFDAHVLYGSSGTPFQHPSTFARHFYGTQGWNWSVIKVTAGDYNGDTYTDVAVVHQITGDAAHVHILWGGSGIPFQHPTTFTRELPASSGWQWAKMIIES